MKPRYEERIFRRTVGLFNRISIDLDRKDVFELDRVTHKLKSMGLKTHVCETEKGYHVWALCRGRVMDILNLRMELGDDPLRVSWDTRWAGIGRYGDYLFFYRRGKYHRMRKVTQ